MQGRLQNTSEEKLLKLLRYPQVARDFMQPSVVAIHEDVSVNDAMDMMTQLGIGSAPVVTRDRRPVGVARWSELVRYQSRAATLLVAATAGPAEDPVSVPSYRFLWEMAGSTEVRSVMSSDVRCISCNASLVAVVEGMFGHEMQRLYVVNEHGTLAGVVSALDVLRQLRR